MSQIIQVVNLTKRLHERVIIDDLSLAVEEGDIFGFIGPNGAGKTTTIRIMATLLAPTSGDVLIDGQSVSAAPHRVRKSIGYLPDGCGLYADMTTWEYLDFFGACHGVHHTERAKLIVALLELVDLSGWKHHQVRHLSYGMRQKLNLARALLHDPKVLVMDNPLSGLDLYARAEFLELLLELSRMGKTIFLSSNNLMDVNQICNRVGILDAGKLVAFGSIQTLLSRLQLTKKILIKVLGRADYVNTILESHPQITDVVVEAARPGEPYTSFQIDFNGEDEKIIELLTVLVRVGVQVLSFKVDRNEMEEIFIRATKGAGS